MFQSFTESADPAQGRARLPLLRVELEARGLDAFILPRTDAHQSEYLAPHDERLAWLTGFTGSAGVAIVSRDRAAIFVDGRYTVQIENQVDPDLFEIVHLIETPPSDWLESNARGSIRRLGFDPWLHANKGLERLRKAAGRAGFELVAVPTNPVDAVWTDQPEPPAEPIEAHALELSGRSTADKLSDLRQTLEDTGDDAVVLSLTDSIAWLFNIRGSDVAHTPVSLAFAVVERDAATLFVDPRKLDKAAREWLEPHARLAPPADLVPALESLGGRSATVRVDPATTPFAIIDALTRSGATLHEDTDPCIRPKAAKNAVEIAGTRASQARDAVAMARFLRWIDQEAASGELDEITAARRLEAFRTETNQLRDISFDTISAAGPNAALPHYRVTEDSNRTIAAGELYLVDSGGQYRDGTTDITRTLAIGEPSAEMRRLFTLVLKGHIAIATARFPKGTTGAQLDTLARTALWNAGFDYDHGTGHGVGSYLSVHEGPQSISKRGHVALEPGMILSNEPGVYREGHFGIRIENLVLVAEPADIEGGERPMMAFETLTFTPIDRRLIDPDLLSDEERAWLNGYHAEVRDRVAASLDGADRDWLTAATEPV